MEIKLKSNSWHSKLYKWTYAADVLPQSLCNYFWALLFSILLTPITMFSKPWDWMRLKPESFITRFLSSIGTLIILMLASLLVLNSIKDPYGALRVFLFILSIIFLFAIIIVGTWGTIEAKDKIVKTDAYQIVSGQAYSVKKKICPKINWK